MRLRLLFSYLDILAPLIALLVVLISFFGNRRKLHCLDILLVDFFGAQLVLNSIASFLEYSRINNQWVYHLNCIVTQGIFSFYFYRLFTDAYRRKVVVVTSVMFCISYAVIVVFIQPYNTFNSYTYAMGAFIIVAYGLMSFYKWMQGMPAQNILALKEFWGAAGVLFYFGSSFFIFISYQYLSSVTPSNVSVLWLLHNVFLSLGCIIFAKAIIAREWIQESSSSSVRRFSHYL